MTNVPVSIICCGPIGLTGALLLARHGIRTLIIDKRTALNTHPRSRFVDTNTMELMRELGLEKEVEDTGLGPDWTACNRWFPSLCGEAFAEIPSPTFHTVPRDTSPTMPVMTCQDYVEQVLLSRVRADPHIDVRFSTEALSLEETSDGTRMVIRNPDGTEETVDAAYTIGADGPHSLVRSIIGSVLDADPRPMYSQDVIFEADLSRQVEGRKGGLLYTATPSGVLVFQPLNGVTRWRCQIFKPDADLLPDDEVVRRIREAIGSEAPVEVRITSTGIWQPTPGCTSKLSEGRIFLAGDAAHVTLPTGGMGNNVGFAGIRNLAWKLAYVLKGHSAERILDTYDAEHRPLALARIEVGVATTEAMGLLFGAFYSGADVAPAIDAARQYGDYDGALLAFELRSALVAEPEEPPPAVADPTIDFVPAIRPGRRAPHVWVDEAAAASVLDWFGESYVLVVGSEADPEVWHEAAEAVVGETGFPLVTRRLPSRDLAPWAGDGVVLVRPDGIIADCWKADAIPRDARVERLTRRLPLRG